MNKFWEQLKAGSGGVLLGIIVMALLFLTVHIVTYSYYDAKLSVYEKYGVELCR